MVLVVREVVVRPAQRSSHASHGRQRKEKEVREDGVAVGSLGRPLRWRTAKVVICLISICLVFCIVGVPASGGQRVCLRSASLFESGKWASQSQKSKVRGCDVCRSEGELGLLQT